MDIAVLNTGLYALKVQFGIVPKESLNALVFYTAKIQSLQKERVDEIVIII